MQWLTIVLMLLSLALALICIRLCGLLGSRKKSEFFYERYRKLVESSTSAVWEYRFEGDRLFSAGHGMNSAAPVEIPDFRNYLLNSGVVHPSSADAFRRFDNELTLGHGHPRCELLLRSNSGKYHWYSVFGITYYDDAGKPLGVFGQLVNIDDDRRTIEMLKEKSDTDALTRLYTRHYIARAVNSMLKLDAKRSRRCALLIIDIDNFRRINEDVGQIFGDALLIELSETLRRIFPKSCLIGRVSGDEFVVFFKERPADEVLRSYAAEVCKCLNHCFLNKSKSEFVSCSVGISRYPEDCYAPVSDVAEDEENDMVSPSESETDAYERLFYLADVALYISKFGGRNSYSIYTSGMEEQLSQMAGGCVTKTVIEGAEFDYEKSPVLRNTSLLSQVIEILFESKELSSSINIIFSLIGRKYGLDHVGVVEFPDEDRPASFSYSWYSIDVIRSNGINDDVTLDDAIRYMLVGDGQDYFVSGDLDATLANSPDHLEFYRSLGVRSCMQCPIRDGGKTCGVIDFSLYTDDHTLSAEAIDELALISKIVGGYIIRLRTQSDIDRISSVDKLTGTMSLPAFLSEAERIISEHPESHYALVYTDVDRFKFINETYGFKAGDDILIRIAQIVSSVQQGGELLSRLSADKFVGLFEYDTQEQLVKRLYECNRLINSIKKTDSDCYKLSMRSGVYLVRGGEDNVSAMLDMANLARKSVKNVHVSTYVLFDDSMKSRIKKQKEIEDVMHSALADGEFIVYYQPKFSLTKGQIVGAEALVRWDRPGYGLLSPNEFIPIFEDNGFIINLDFYLLDVVCRKLRRDIDIGLTVHPISVNFSRIHLNTDNFIERVRECLETYHIPPNLIEIEVTESAVTENEDYLLEIINALHKIGIVISMDDFGSGYSSLNLLKKLPFDVLKIDKDFFNDSGATEREQLIIANVVNMAKGLGIKVVSEGVETAEQASFLRDINCDQVQGFLFAQPMDVDTFERLYQQPPKGSGSAEE